ncbi:MAG: hypothetical protein AAGB14_10970, partial [Verrucomicrobiota bacterium]
MPPVHDTEAESLLIMLIPSLKGFFAIGEAMSVDTRNMGFMMSLQHCNQGMIEVYRDREMARIGQLKGLLESEGIKTFVLASPNRQVLDFE